MKRQVFVWGLLVLCMTLVSVAKCAQAQQPGAPQLCCGIHPVHEQLLSCARIPSVNQGYPQ